MTKQQDEKHYYEQIASFEEYIKWYKQQDLPKYEKPSYTADMIAFRYHAGKIEFPIIKRKAHPYRECYALPGGFVEPHETGKQAVVRELHEETSLVLDEDVVYTLDTYDNPERDPRGWVVSKAHIVYLPSTVDWELKAGDDAKSVYWATLDIHENKIRLGDEVLAASDLAFDHYHIIMDALIRIKGLATWNPVYLQLLGDTFILSEATELTNLILDKPIQVNNFKRDYQYCLEETGDRVSRGQGRPALLYRFKSQLL